jgi:mono/diheme cytochrome c family protein
MRVLAALMLGFALHSAAADLRPGEQTYVLWCAGCHSAQGTPGRPMPAGTAVLQERYQGRIPATLVDRTDLMPAYIEQLVRHGRNAMPFFRKTEITDAQLAELAAWFTRKKN